MFYLNCTMPDISEKWYYGSFNLGVNILNSRHTFEISFHFLIVDMSIGWEKQ